MYFLKGAVGLGRSGERLQPARRTLRDIAFTSDQHVPSLWDGEYVPEHVRCSILCFLFLKLRIKSARDCHVRSINEIQE